MLILIYIYLSLTHLNPNMSNVDALQKTLSIAQNSAHYNIDWRTITAILFQESSLKNDPQGCLKGTCGPDWGIGQVRVSVWGKELGLDKIRLLKSPHYAISVTGKILNNYKKRFAKREVNWYSRYHSGTKKFRKIYERKIAAHIIKIDKLIMEGGM